MTPDAPAEFDRVCREQLGLTGDHFLRAYSSGALISGPPAAFERVLAAMRAMWAAGGSG